MTQLKKNEQFTFWLNLNSTVELNQVLAYVLIGVMQSQ